MDQLTNQITTASNSIYSGTNTGTISIDYDSAITTASNTVWSTWTTGNYFNSPTPTHGSYTSADKQICTDEEWEKLCEEQGLIDGDVQW